jgi:hypothetical protein
MAMICLFAYCGVLWCDVMWCDVMWCDVMWNDAVVVRYVVLSTTNQAPELSTAYVHTLPLSLPLSLCPSLSLSVPPSLPPSLPQVYSGCDVYAFTGPQELSHSVSRSSLRTSTALPPPPAVTQAPDVSAEKAATLSAIADGCGEFEVSVLPPIPPPVIM